MRFSKLSPKRIVIKMANPNIGTIILSKGVRLSVIVEYCFENIIAVVLAHNGKEYRGVLLENELGFFPHGIPFFNKSVPDEKLSLNISKNTDTTKLDLEHKPPSSIETTGSKVELSAVVSRFSYNTNPFLVNPRPVQEIPTVELKAVGTRRKTVRDIRLRPRQTLCSKCKSAIHDSHKSYPNINNAFVNSNSTSGIISSLRSSQRRNLENATHSTPTLTTSLRKRKSVQTPMVLLEDIHKCSKMTPDDRAVKTRGTNSLPYPSNKRCITRSNSSNRIAEYDDLQHAPIKARLSRSTSSGNPVTTTVESDLLKILDNSVESRKTTSITKNCKKDKAVTSSSVNPKPSPTIKISIKDGEIIEIRPKFAETSDNDHLHNSNHLPVPKIKIQDISSLPENPSHKKAKKAAKKSKERDKIKINFKDDSEVIVNSDDTVPYKTQKKHKKKHRHKHNNSSSTLNLYKHCIGESYMKIDNELNRNDTNNSFELNADKCIESESAISTAAADENHENTFPSKNRDPDRPRLVYTWKQNEGLSRVSLSPRNTPNVSPKYTFKTSPGLVPLANSPHRRKNASPARVVSASPNWHFTTSPNRLLKDYPLRSKSNTSYSTGLGSETVPVADYSVVHTTDDSQSHSSGMDCDFSDFSVESGEERMPDDFFPGNNSPSKKEEDKGIKPLMMKIQTQSVSGCMIEEGREIRVGDIVWGKIQGFPWWPGRVSNITVIQRDNDVVITQLAKVTWFGSNTMSHMHCSDLFPFLKDFKVRYNKKKKGQYRVAIKQATMAAQLLASESDRDFVFEDFDSL